MSTAFVKPSIGIRAFASYPSQEQAFVKGLLDIGGTGSETSLNNNHFTFKN